MSEAATAKRKPKSGLDRALRFALGLVAGVAIAPLLFVVFIVAAMGREKLSPPHPEPVGGWPPLISTRGADISERGGAVVLLEGRDNRIQQTCRDGCDDLLVESGLGFSKVQILAGGGVCLLCRSADRSGRSRSWTVSGQPTLALTSKDVR